MLNLLDKKQFWSSPQRRSLAYLLGLTSAVALCSSGMLLPLPQGWAGILLGSSKQAQASPHRPMTLKSSAPQSIQQLIEKQARGWENADSKSIIEDFAEEALFVVPGSVFKGRSAIKAAAEDYFSQFSQTQITIDRIVVSGNEGVVEWRWSDVNDRTGEKTLADDAIVFELEDGKIKYWREYIDTQSPAQE
ncbi:MAG: nuclear transport factor 2 family protein [Cyanophyceae cyanobacterium]